MLIWGSGGSGGPGGVPGGSGGHLAVDVDLFDEHLKVAVGQVDPEVPEP